MSCSHCREAIRRFARECSSSWLRPVEPMIPQKPEDLAIQARADDGLCGGFWNGCRKIAFSVR
jgi:hypothetical protein